MYVFGGRRDETYFDDLWALNMETLTWELLFPMDGRTLTGLPTRPAARTNHASAVHGTDLLIFGGSDGEYHYSDLWAFDTEQYMWKQVRSEGPNPRSREGHAMVIVDHTLWVFGGRGSAGKDLAELSSCDLRYPRWYCFKNVASTPAPRSEHVMVAVKDHVFVLGGFDSKSNATEPYTIHVLDTGTHRMRHL
ncbi:galactose oxidase [Panus rudis PR-1116 ss-1]|nr:galactose oxidase [Panus rudis PR-1116 ss-1]